MTTHYNYVERAGWGPGPWDGEPDRVFFMHRGLHCMILRSEVTGVLCGYVGVPRRHAAFRVAYEFVEKLGVRAHGGLTWSAHLCRQHDPDQLWWLGFDCGHAFDVQPGLDATLKQVSGHTMTDMLRNLGTDDPWFPIYRTIDYVRQECIQLAEQLCMRELWCRTAKRYLRRQQALAVRDQKRERDRHDRIETKIQGDNSLRKFVARREGELLPRPPAQRPN